MKLRADQAKQRIIYYLPTWVVKDATLLFVYLKLRLSLKVQQLKVL